jgi:predicted MFS family arabinose efflux permease
MNKGKIAILVFSSLTLLYFLSIVHRVGIAVIANDLMVEFSADASLIGLMSSTYFYPYAAAQIPIGIMLDRIGIRKTVAILSSVACVGGFVFATGGDILTLSLGRALLGFGVGGFYVSALKAIAVWFDARQFATMSGLMNSIANVGAIVATTPLALMTLYIGWRGSFLVILVMMVAGTAIAWVTIKEDNNRSFKSTGTIIADLRKVFTSREFLKILPLPFLIYGCYIGFQGLWGGPFLMDVYGMDKATSGFYLMFIGIGFAICSPIAGFISDKVLKRRKPALILGQLLSLSFWVILALAGNQLPPVGLIVTMLLIGVGHGFIIIYMTVSKELFETNITGTAMASFNTFQAVGGGVFQSLMGVMLAASFSGARTFAAYQTIFVLGVACLTFTTFLTLACKETHPLRLGQPPEKNGSQ